MSLLQSTVLLFGTALLTTLVLRVIRVPTVAGFLLAGVLIARFVPPDAVENLAEVGLVLLMFTVGLELSPRRLWTAGRRTVGVGALQIAATTAVVFAVAWIATRGSATAAVVVGVTVAISSTAIVLKWLADRAETDTPAGRVIVSALLLQDLAVVAFLLILPLMAGVGGAHTEASFRADRLAILLGSLVAAWFGLPRLVSVAARLGGRELLALLAVVCAAAGAWLAAEAGWSPALGAFLFGLVLAESDERHQLAAEILPFRDVFNALFFMSIGMLLNVRLVAEQPLAVIGAILAVLIVKALVAGGIARLLGWPVRVSTMVGIGLSTMSEFALPITHEALSIGVIDGRTREWLMAVTVGSMLFGALWLSAAPRLAAMVDAIRLRGRRRIEADAASQDVVSGHVIIVGYGLNGANLARVLRASGIPYTVVEMNRTLAAHARADGCDRVLAGDATGSWMLQRGGVDTARALVVAINDVEACRRIVSLAAQRRPDLFILARSRFVSEIETLSRLGATRVIPEEFETSIELFAHVLKEYGVADNVVAAHVEMVRAGGYRMLRGLPASGTASAELMRVLEATATQTYQLLPDGGAAGRTLRELDLRARTGVTIIAIVRSGKPTTSPPPEMRLEVGDVLVLVGAHAGLEKAKALLRALPAGRTLAEGGMV
ncbi:MAG: cation:proton antiporter [Phycisphaerae bacterium]